MDPVLGAEVIDAEQSVIDDLGHSRGPLHVELAGEGLRVLTVLGVADLRQHRLRRRLHGRGQGIGRVRHVVDAALRLGGLEPNRAQCSRKPPRAPSPTTTIGALMPRQFEFSQQLGPAVSRLSVAVGDGQSSTGKGGSISAGVDRER